ncbi:MAG: hypothetical protein FK733_06550 [Asgard group archaeon]|nr:hypothetical protein [Asgard group archaeon]
MGKITCNYCGEYIEKDSRFCYFCGSSVGTDKVPIEESETGKGDIYSHTIEKEPTHKVSKTKVKRKAVSGIIIAVVIIAALGVILPTTFISIYGPLRYKYIGATTYSSDAITTNNATLTVYNFAGDVNVEYNPYITEVLMVEIFVYGRSEADISEAEEFIVSTEGGTYEFIFIDDTDYTFWDKTAMRYEIFISLNPSVNFAFDIEAYSGNIEFDLDYLSNSNITGVKLDTFSGNIDADFGMNREINAPTFHAKTTSGNIDLFFGTGTTVNTTNFNVEAFSGNIEVDFESTNELMVEGGQIELSSTSGRSVFRFDSGKLNASVLQINNFSGNVFLILGTATEITLNEVSIDVESGNIDIECDLCTFYSNITWNIMGFSGNVDIRLDPTILANINYTAEFNVDITSGDIDIEYGFSEINVGVQIEAVTTSGNINLPGGLGFYQSPDYALKMKKYIFDLETFSGNIDVFGYD